MRLEDTYMLVFSLLLIKVNGGGGNSVQFFPSPIATSVSCSFLVLLEINQFSNSFLFVDFPSDKGEGDPCVDNPNGSYKLYCPHKPCGLNERYPAEILQANEIAMPAVQVDSMFHDLNETKNGETLEPRE